MVPEVGFAPTRLSAADFKSASATSYDTQAVENQIEPRERLRRKHGS